MEVLPGAPDLLEGFVDGWRAATPEGGFRPIYSRQLPSLMGHSSHGTRNQRNRSKDRKRSATAADSSHWREIPPALPPRVDIESVADRFGSAQTPELIMAREEIKYSRSGKYARSDFPLINVEVERVPSPVLNASVDIGGLTITRQQLLQGPPNREVKIGAVSFPTESLLQRSESKQSVFSVPETYTSHKLSPISPPRILTAPLNVLDGDRRRVKNRGMTRVTRHGQFRQNILKTQRHYKEIVKILKESRKADRRFALNKEKIAEFRQRKHRQKAASKEHADLLLESSKHPALLGKVHRRSRNHELSKSKAFLDRFRRSMKDAQEKPNRVSRRNKQKHRKGSSLMKPKIQRQSLRPSATSIRFLI